MKEKTNMIHEATLLHEKLEKVCLPHSKALSWSFKIFFFIQISNWSSQAEAFLEKYSHKDSSLTFDQMQTVNSQIIYLDEKLESLEMKKIKNFEDFFKDLYTKKLSVSSYIYNHFINIERFFMKGYKLLKEKVVKVLTRFECVMHELNKHKKVLEKVIQSPTHNESFENKNDNPEHKIKNSNGEEQSSESPVKTIHHFFNFLYQRKSSFPSDLIKKNAFVNLIPLHLHEYNSRSTNSSAQNTPELFSIDAQTPFVNAQNKDEYSDEINTEKNYNIKNLIEKKVNRLTKSFNNFTHVTNLQKCEKLTSQLSLNEDYVDFNNNSMTTSENENETIRKDFNNNIFSKSMFENHNNDLKYSSANSLSVTQLNLSNHNDSKFKKKFSFIKVSLNYHLL